MILDKLRGSKEPESPVVGVHFGLDRFCAAYVDPESKDRNIITDENDRAGWPVSTYHTPDEVIHAPTPQQIGDYGMLFEYRHLLRGKDVDEIKKTTITGLLGYLKNIYARIDEECDHWNGEIVVSMPNWYLHENEPMFNFRVNLLDQAGFEVVEYLPSAVASTIGLGLGPVGVLPRPEARTEEICLASAASGAALDLAIISVTYPFKYTVLAHQGHDNLGEIGYAIQLFSYLTDRLEARYGSGTASPELIPACVDLFHELIQEPDDAHTLTLADGYETADATVDVEITLDVEEYGEIFKFIRGMTHRTLQDFLTQTGRVDGGLDTVILSGETNLHRQAYSAYMSHFGTTMTTPGVNAAGFEEREVHAREAGDVPIRYVGGLQMAALGASCLGTFDAVDVEFAT